MAINNLRYITKDGIEFNGTKLYKTPSQHGKKEIIKPICDSIGMPYDTMGVIFKSENEKTLYIAGDTIWYDEVKETIDKYCPDVIIVNACGATVLNGERIIMNHQDVKEISDYAKKSTIIVSHMDTVSHLTVTRNDIKALKLNNVLVPEDNEMISL